jgi:polyphosphate kinase 2 (PPK2 family)
MLELEKIRTLHKQITKLGDRRIAFVLEGRDASGKGGFVKLLFKYDIPFTLRHQGTPTKTRSKAWLSDYAKVMPRKGEIVIFDRSWHTRSWVQPVLGYCTQNQYKNHISRVHAWEQKQEKKGIEITKNWLSIDKNLQEYILNQREQNKPWKFSPTDATAIELFDEITEYKKVMFVKCPTWNIIPKSISKERLLDLLIKATEEKDG